MKVAPGYTACCDASPVWRNLGRQALVVAQRLRSDEAERASKTIPKPTTLTEYDVPARRLGGTKPKS